MSQAMLDRYRRSVSVIIILVTILMLVFTTARVTYANSGNQSGSGHAEDGKAVHLPHQTPHPIFTCVHQGALPYPYVAFYTMGYTYWYNARVEIDQRVYFPGKDKADIEDQDFVYTDRRGFYSGPTHQEPALFPGEYRLLSTIYLSNSQGDRLELDGTINEYCTM